jgi:hypothetical protein
LRKSFLDRSTVNHDKRPIVPRRCHDHARHVLITSWYRNIGVMSLDYGEQ